MVCLSGKGIGKALMSKVAQVSKTGVYHLTATCSLFMHMGSFLLVELPEQQ